MDRFARSLAVRRMYSLLYYSCILAQENAFVKGFFLFISSFFRAS